MSDAGGVLESLRLVASSFVGAVQTRLTLFAMELEEQGARYANVALLWAIGGFCAGVAILMFALFLVVLFWDSHRLLVLGLLAAAFSAGALAAIVGARSLLSGHPRPFADSLAELERDRQALGGRAGKP